MTAVKDALNKKFSLGKSIRCRSGWMWYLKDKPNRIIKVTQDESDLKLGVNFDKVLNYLKQIQSPSVVKVYEFGSVIIKGKSPYYYHVMEQLFPIPNNADGLWVEKILWDYYYNHRKIPAFCSKNIQNFLLRIKKLKIKHHDLHLGNIMLDRFGKLKLIDLESFL